MESWNVTPGLEETLENFEALIKEEGDEGDHTDGMEYMDEVYGYEEDLEEDDEEEVEIRMNEACDVIISATDPLDDDHDITMKDEDVFHLADEHELFGRAAGGPQHVQGECSRARGQGRGRGRGRGRRQQTDVARWLKGNRLIEININDADVSEELRDMVLKVVVAREEVRVRATAYAKRQRMGNQATAQADDVEDVALFAGGEHSPRFEWSSMDTYQGKREQFLPKKIGPVVASANAYGAFRQYWDDGILSHIVKKTNQYAAEIARTSNAFARGWYDTNIDELLVLLSFWMMLGIIKMPSTKSCFTDNPLLHTNIFRKLFSRNRYEHLCRALYFADIKKRPTDTKDPLFCFGPVLDHLNSRFKSAYIPSREICIDDSITLWKGNLSFRQSVTTQPTRVGVKSFELCESSTGYLYSFFLYVGGATTYDPAFPSTLRKSTATVLKLIHPLLDKGYMLFMNSWFNSPLLARFLKTRKTDCAGVLHPDRCDVPPLISLCDLKEGQFISRHSGDMTVLAYHDGQKKVTTISTCHGNSQGQIESKSRRPLYKPRIILDYNKGMGGVNRKDQMLEPYLLERKKCAQWHMKVFKRLLNCSILNARIHLQASTGKSEEHIVFRLELVDQILKQHLENASKRKPVVAREVPLSSPHKSQNKHWPKQLTNMLDNGRRSRRRCVWCTQHNHIQKRTSFVCSACDIALCVQPCFQLYHTSVEQ